MKIYVASSWRNEYQQEVVKKLRKAGFEVYDYKHPAPGNEGFHWSEIDPEWQAWDASEFIEGLGHPLAERGFASDFVAMATSDVILLVQPCGRSAHLELGWGVGAKKFTMVLLESGEEPELMYLLADYLCITLGEVIDVLKVYEADPDFLLREGAQGGASPRYKPSKLNLGRFVPASQQRFVSARRKR